MVTAQLSSPIETATPVVPAASSAPEVVPASEGPTEAVSAEAGFARAIALGAALGVVVFGAIMAVCVKLMAPDMAASGVLAIAAWSGLWGGVFLGGTVTVGLWSHRNH